MGKSLADFIQAARHQIREIDCDTLEDWLRIRDDVLVVDVREASAFLDGHLPGAIHVPRGYLEALADPDYGHCHPELAVARDRVVVLYCDSGTRSALAAVTLQEMGFTEVYNLGGGINVWDAEDKPVVS
ncbi:rhodanese-like domain-containing protein [Acidithiobacillus ferrooxidans]|uniref:rhodanese-like domain-containing protein n=1 Tax=Acidithiobacillus ferrooxidans TaxID=920 RepID=UPI001C072FDA|nr:rhodanese-like domain-containing protein [Acidithiobacillus ferrooxidans]MBU2857512.1 rhodanese-like domain-containing protein [Acidithiobacillus ferrooxidans]MBU2859860.1 rhodanese-like domain-containing protein [Acidithiobacillus ferrooxidans]